LNSSASHKKKKLRQHYLAVRKALSDDVYESKSRTITENFKKWLDTQNVNHIHCYISMRARREASTKELIRWLLKNHYIVSVPVVNFKDNSLEHYQVPPNFELTENKWGVMEPGPGQRVKRTEPALFDIVIVPVVAADKKGTRLGYGKGFYDRFLAQTNALKAGLVFSNCVTGNELPGETFDVPMDILITENGIIRPES